MSIGNLRVVILTAAVSAILIKTLILNQSFVLVEASELSAPAPVPTKLSQTSDLDQQIKCMARNMYFEAKSEGEIGMAAVARVVVNRINHGFGDTPCEVIHSAHTVARKRVLDGETVIRPVKVCQFSWVCESGKVITNPVKYEASLDIARRVLVDNAYSEILPENTLFYHADYVSPNWRNVDRYKVIGRHIFYTVGKPSYHAQRES